MLNINIKFSLFFTWISSAFVTCSWILRAKFISPPLNKEEEEKDDSGSCDLAARTASALEPEFGPLTRYGISGMTWNLKYSLEGGGIDPVLHLPPPPLPPRGTKHPCKVRSDIFQEESWETLSENSLVWTFVFLLKCDKMTKNRRPAGNGLDAGRREAGGRIEQSNRQNFCSQTLFKGELWQS